MAADGVAERKQAVSVHPKHKLALFKTAFIPLRASLKDTLLASARLVIFFRHFM